jgi:hypothetical protein
VFGVGRSGDTERAATVLGTALAVVGLLGALTDR